MATANAQQHGNDTKDLSARLATLWGQAYRGPRTLASSQTPESPTDGGHASVHRLDTRRRARR